VSDTRLSSDATPYAPTAPTAGVPASAPAAGGERHLRFRPDIEGLRAVAILLVVLYHAGFRYARSGFLGVDVFFVLSGFLLTGLLLDEITATGRVSLTRFWARRARRLLPAAALVTLVVLVANAAWLTPFAQHGFAETARAFAVYGSNILFAVRSTDYFGGAAVRDPLLHTWSLSVEEQFYLFFAPAMLLVGLWFRSRGAERARRRLAIAAVAVTVLSLAGGVLVVGRYPVIAFYALPARAWEFGLGALAVLAARHAGRMPRPALDLLALGGLSAIVGSSALFHENAGPILGLRTLVPTLGTVAVILAGAGAYRTVAGRALGLAPVRLIGRLSYSWYLWHWPALVYLRERVGDPSVRLSVAVALASLVPAAIAYRFVESPIRFSTRLARRPRQVVVAALGLAALTVAASAGASRFATWTLAQPRYAAILAAHVHARTYADNCHLSLLALESPECRYGPARSDTTMVLFGDSHAAQWFPALDSVARMRGWSIVNLTKSSCPAATVTIANAILQRAYVECDRWREHVIRRIRETRPAIVVLAGANTYPLQIGNEIQYTDSSAVARRTWHDGIVRTLEALRPSGARLVVMEDTPQMRRDIPRCLVQLIDHPRRCDMARRRALDPRAAASDRHAASVVPGAVYLSLTDRICDETACPAMRDGVVRYADDNHLAVRFAESLGPALSAELTRVLAAPEPSAAPAAP
jgi:peptidoglycan/LPS O-acetylase OafA/YrhL